MAETLNTRVTRLEGLVEVLAEKQAKLDDVLVLLTEAQIRTEQRFQEAELQFQKVQEQFQDVAQRFRETDERFRQTDVRIENLVSALGEMLRKPNGRA